MAKVDISVCPDCGFPNKNHDDFICSEAVKAQQAAEAKEILRDLDDEIDEGEIEFLWEID